MKRNLTPTPRDFKAWEKFTENLLDGVAHYFQLVASYPLAEGEIFERNLEEAESEIHKIQRAIAVSNSNELTSASVV
jgi:hypothetical protein